MQMMNLKVNSRVKNRSSFISFCGLLLFFCLNISCAHREGPIVMVLVFLIRLFTFYPSHVVHIMRTHVCVCLAQYKVCIWEVLPSCILQQGKDPY